MKRRGRGMACMWYPIGFTVAANPSAAVVKVNEDGTATLLTGTVETGQGSLTILAQITAQELGIATDDVHVVSADTDATPMDTGAIASRTTYVTGNAARMAAEKAKLILFDVAAPLLGVKATQLEAQDHKIFVKGFPQRNMHIGDVANHARVVSGQPPIGSASFNPETLALDPETGQGKPFGTYVYAIGGNAEAARLAGIPIKTVTILTYVLCALLAALVGIMFAGRVHSAQPLAGNGWELDTITAVALGGVSLFGGRGNLLKVFLASLMLALLSNGFVLLGLSSYAQMITKGLILLLGVAFDVLLTQQKKSVSL